MQPRKYITVQRSAHKESPKASYQNLGYRQAYDTNFHGGRFSSSNTNLVRIRDQPDKIKYQELNKTPSQSNFKTRQQQIRSNIARKRGDGMVSNLKSQLLNLKMEVSKLTNKQRDTDNKIFTYKRGSIQAVDYDLDNQSVKSSSSNNYAKQISDTISVTSQKIIDEPLRRLESKFSSGGYDHGHYMELQNDLLKTQLRNLKNKYNATKQQLKQKCQALQRKNQYLEVSLRRSDQALTQCKKSLQVQLQTIKFQVSRKLQQQYQDEQKKNQRSIQPVRDNLGNNELVQQKLNKLYEQLSDKTKMISSINIQYNQLKGQFEKKSFELKKQLQKNSQLSKQLQFSKRQNLRNKNLLEIEINKKNQLNKTIETLKQKNNQMSKQLHLQNSIVTDSQELQNKYAKQLEQHKQNEEKLQQQNYELKNQIKKQKQLIDSHEQQIKHLKKTINDFTSQLQQTSKNLRIQKQKSIQLQQTYRKLLDQAKQSGQRQLQILQQQYDNYRQSSRQITSYTDLQQPKQKQNMIKKQKDRQISRWKTEYKMLKIKYDENLALQQNKKQQLEEYYKNYKQYKTKNKILEMRNKILQESANSYIQKIQKIESQNLQQRIMNLQKNNRVALENQQLQRKIQEMQEQFNQLRNALQIEIQRANSQQNYRKQLQKSILNQNLTQSAQKMPSQNLQKQKLQQLIQTIQKIRKKLSDQDQKINKNIKQLKTKDNLIKQLKKQIKTLLQNQQNQLQKFRIKQITQYMQQIKLNNNISLQQLKKQYKKQLSIQINNNKQLLQQNNNIKKYKNNLQNQVNKLKQEIKNITYLYNIKQTQYIHILQQKQQDRKYNINKIQQIENNKNKRFRYLQNQIINKKQQIQNNRMQIKRYLTMRNNVQMDNFDEALKNQIEAAKRYREELSKKNQQVYRIRDTYAILKTQLDNLKSQSDIAKLKFISDKKNIQIQFDVQSQNLKSQLSLQQKKVISLQQKIKLVIDQNKKKDNFIQTYIMGKKLPTNQKQLVATFIKQYQICLKGKQISEKLQAESQELQKLSKYNFNLMKEIAEMKEKLLMYQAIQNDGVYTQNQYNTNDKQLLTSKSFIKSHNSLEAKEFD